MPNTYIYNNYFVETLQITVEVEVHDELDKQTPCKDEPNVNHTLGKPTDVNEETQPLEHSGGPWPAGVNVETQPLGQSGEPADVNGEIQPLDHPDKPTNLSGGAHAQTQATNTTDQVGYSRFLGINLKHALLELTFRFLDRQAKLFRC